MSEIGHNKPPDMCVTAGEVTNDLSRWMAEHPVIQTDVEAKEAKVFIDRANLCVKDMEDERKAQTGPLNEAVKKINDTFRGPRELLERVNRELRDRMDRFLTKIESDRRSAAAAAIIAREQAERDARNAESLEQDAIRGAESGELDVDVAGVTRNADAAFADFKAAERAAELAERAQKVKVTGGFTRALSLKSYEIFEIEEPIVAVTAILEHEMGFFVMQDAILKAARAYKRMTGKFPPGIKVTTERRS